jgi:hypothetical protein
LSRTVLKLRIPQPLLGPTETALDLRWQSTIYVGFEFGFGISLHGFKEKTEFLPWFGYGSLKEDAL